jgi:hypothetical protein
MAVTATPVFVQNPKVTPVAFVNATASTKQTIVSAGANGTKVLAMFATSTETATARTFNIWLTRSGTSYLLITYTVPINSGFDGVAAPLNMFSNWPSLPVDNDGQRYLFLESGDTLQASCTTSITAGKEIDITAVFGNF